MFGLATLSSGPTLAAELALRSGGAATVYTQGENAFAQPLPGLPVEDLRRFTFGNRLFNTTWTTAPGSVSSFDGLGPLFNRSSCSGCHTRDGRGRPPESGARMTSMLMRVSRPGRGPNGGPRPDPVYGLQLNESAILGAAPEGRTVIDYETLTGQYADGTGYALVRPRYALTEPGYGPFAPDLLTSPRVAPAIHGLGLLEAVPEAEIRAHADPDDRDGDGISGRPNFVHDVEQRRTVMGRFGWKANQPSLRQQCAAAAVGDIGLTNVLFPREELTPQQAAAAALPSGADADGVELATTHLDRLVFYTRTLAVPAARDVGDPEVRHGAMLFERLRCSACHVPTLHTGAQPDVPQLSQQTIHPYTDLLLHDMGPGLADGRPDFAASGSEWRTAPLWGIGLVETVNRHTRFLHDGRARSLEEAILWHGGEALAARRGFERLERADRLALLRFIGAL